MVWLTGAADCAAGAPARALAAPGSRGAPAGGGDRPPQQALALEAQMAGMLKAQAEMQGRMGAMADVFGARQAELTQSLSQRLDAMTGRIGPDHDRADHAPPMRAWPAAGAAGGHRHRAGQHPGAGRPGRAVAGDPVQQADARGLRPVAHGGDRRRRPADGGLSNSRRRCRTAAGPDCLVICPTARRRWSSTPSFRSKPGTPSAHAEGAGAPKCRAPGLPPRHRAAHPAISPKNT